MFKASTLPQPGLMRFPLVYLHQELEALAGTDICYLNRKPGHGDTVSITLHGVELIVIARERQTAFGRETYIELPEADRQELLRCTQPGGFVTDNTPIGKLVYRQAAASLYS